MKNRVDEVLDIVQRVSALGNYDSNVIGMAAEIVAEDVFGMTKASRGTKDIDGFWMVGQDMHTVQVKAWSEARIQKYKAGTFLRIKTNNQPDKLLVLLIYSSRPGYEVIFNGSPNDVGYVEKSGLTRAIRFDAMKSKTEIQELLSQI
jgi:hypothetical protein